MSADAIGPYAAPRFVDTLDDCIFYHTLDIPGYGRVKGQWDLRSRIDNYLGRIDFQGKRVLEVGTGSGFVCFHMERRGAEVVAYDLSEAYEADVVPFTGYDHRRGVDEMKQFIRGVNNGFWLCHRLFASKAKVVYGTAYEIPEAIGPVDVSVFGAILLHLRDPFRALHSALRLTCESVIVTEPIWHWHWPRFLLDFLSIRRKFNGYAVFLPDGEKLEPKTTWWLLSPAIVRQFLGVLGFGQTHVTYHFQKSESGGRVLFYTVVGRRTR